jgi:hypothetical protein
MHILWKVRSHHYQLPQETTIVYSLSHFHSHATSSRFEKWRCPISIGIVRLDLGTSCVQNNPSLDPTPCFLLPITIKYNRSMTMETKTLFDCNASVCFIDKELVQWHKMIIMKKNTSIVVKVIDGRSLSSRLVMSQPYFEGSVRMKLTLLRLDLGVLRDSQNFRVRL